MKTRVVRLLGLSVMALMLARRCAVARSSRRRRRRRSQEPAASPAADYPKVVLTAGRSTVLATDFDITRLAVTNPAMADATVVQPREVLIDGKAPGTISLIVWGDRHARCNTTCRRSGRDHAQQQLQTLFPGEDIRVAVNDEALVLSGSVSSNG